MLQQPVHHLLPARAPLFERHHRRGSDLTRHLFRILRIDLQCRRQLLRRSSKLGQHQNSRIRRVLRGDVFLADEIHSVT